MILLNWSRRQERVVVNWVSWLGVTCLVDQHILSSSCSISLHSSNNFLRFIFIITCKYHWWLGENGSWWRQVLWKLGRLTLRRLRVMHRRRARATVLFTRLMYQLERAYQSENKATGCSEIYASRPESIQAISNTKSSRLEVNLS